MALGTKGRVRGSRRTPVHGAVDSAIRSATGLFGGGKGGANAGRRKATGRKNFKTGRPTPTSRANAKAEARIRALSGKLDIGKFSGGASSGANRASVLARSTGNRRPTATSRTTSNPIRRVSGPTGSTARTRAVSATAAKVAARNKGISASAARKKARAIVKKRG